jgi:hypothetical protein
VTDVPDPNASTTNATDGVSSTSNIHDFTAFRDSMRTKEMATTPTMEREDGPAGAENITWLAGQRRTGSNSPSRPSPSCGLEGLKTLKTIAAFSNC